MALQDISLTPFPEIARANYLMSDGFSGITLDALGEKWAAIFRVPKTGTLGKIWFYVRGITTAQDLKVSFQDVDPATGDPDGTVDQYRVITPTSYSWNRTGLITSDGTDTGAKRSVTKGDLLAVAIEFGSVAGDLVIAYIGGDVAWRDTCYLDSYTTGAWVRSSSPFLALEYDDGSCVPILGAYCHFANTITASVAAGAEGGTRGKVPFKCRAAGLYFALGHSTSTSFQVTLYASDGVTVLGSVTQDSDVGVGKGKTSPYIGAWMFSTPISLNANDIVFVCVTPTGGPIYLADSVLASSTLWAAALRSSDWYKVTRAAAGSGAFTETTDTIIWAGLILDQLDDGAGGGGGLLVHPGMSGGMRG